MRRTSTSFWIGVVIIALATAIYMRPMRNEVVGISEGFKLSSGMPTWQIVLVVIAALIVLVFGGIFAVPILMNMFTT